MRDNIEQAFEPMKNFPSEKQLLQEAIKLLKLVKPNQTGMFLKKEISEFLKKVGHEQSI